MIHLTPQTIAAIAAIVAIALGVALSVALILVAVHGDRRARRRTPPPRTAPDSPRTAPAPPPSEPLG